MLRVWAFIDTGSDVTILSSTLADKLGLSLQPRSGNIVGIAGHLPRQSTSSPVSLWHGRSHTTAYWDVQPTLPGAEYLLLGRDSLADLHLTMGPIELDFAHTSRPPDDDDFIDYSIKPPRLADGRLPLDEETRRETIRQRIQVALQRHLDLVPVDSFISHPDAVVRIEHVDGTPPAYTPQYPAKNPDMREALTKQVQAWLVEGRIQRYDGTQAFAESFPRYNIPLMTVVTRDANQKVKKIRCCIDARQLNNGLVMDNAPLGNIRDIYQQMGSFKYFSEFDLRSAFTQFPVHRDDQHKLTFTWQGVQYSFRSAIFGLAHMAQTCSRVLTSIFSGLPNCFVYCDNLLVASRTLEEHEQHCSALIEICNQFNIRLQPDKCVLVHTRLKTLGNILSGTGIEPDPDKVNVTWDFPIPTCADDVCSFLSYTGYMRQFVRHYASLAAPLDTLRNAPPSEWRWEAEHQLAFDTIKSALRRAPILRHPDFTKPFSIAVDSSISGCGACLYQPDSPRDLPSPNNIVMMASRALRGYERGYSVYKLEANALVWALREFDEYIFGRHVTVLTDHNALVYLHQTKGVNRILQGWFSELSEYQFSIFHTSGRSNVLADALSRRYPRTWGVEEHVPSPADTDMLHPFAAICDIAPHDFTSDPNVIDFQVLHDSRSDTPTVVAYGHVDDAYTEFPLSAPAETTPTPTRSHRTPVSDAHARELVEHAHTFGHFGTRAVHMQLTKDGYLWDGMAKLIREVCHSCKSCQSWSLSNTPFNPLQSVRANLPWDRIQIDFTAPLDKTPSGMTCALLVTDVFTGYTLIRPLPDKEALTAAECLWHIMADFGVPQQIQTDGDGTFVSAVVQELIHNHGAEHKTIPAYVPRVNGKVERHIGTATTLLHKLVAETGRPWDSLAPAAQLMLNTKHRHATNSCPFALFFNRTLNRFASYTNSSVEHLTADDELAWIARERLLHDTIFPTVHFRTDAVEKKSHVTFEESHLNRSRHLPCGALVMLRDVLRTSKSSPPWVGPYTIVRVSPIGLYTLRDAVGGIFQRDVPRDHLKILTDANISSDGAYYVDRIVDRRLSHHGGYEYLVEWTGMSEKSWVQQHDIHDTELIRSYLQTQPRLPRKAHPSSSSTRVSRSLSRGASASPTPRPSAASSSATHPPPPSAASLPAPHPAPLPPRGERPTVDPKLNRDDQFLWDNPSKHATERLRIRITSIDDTNATASFTFPDHPATREHTKPWSEIISATAPLLSRIGSRTRRHRQ